MTTSTETLIRANAPITEIFYTNGDVDPQMTAVSFIERNVRQIVNRRMRWSDVEGFVVLAVDRLINEITNINSITSVSRQDRAILLDSIRQAANRRQRWLGPSGAAAVLRGNTDLLIRSCLGETT